MNKLKTQFKDGCDTIPEALGIPEDRIEELEFRFNLIMHEYFKPTKDQMLPPTDQILKLYIALAENQQELILCAYFAGMKIEEIFGEMLTEDEQQEDEE